MGLLNVTYKEIKMKKRMLSLLFFTSLLLTTNASGSMINFETVPNGTSADKLAISTQYATDYGVTFGLDTDGNGSIDETPHLEQVGSSDTGYGFVNNNLGQYDSAASGFESRLGNYFLRFGTSNFMSSPVPIFTISYSTPVNAASAEIWDIDGDTNNSEKWIVSALDNQRNIIDTILSPEHFTFGNESLDGKPWTWSFNHSPADISQITITFAGTKTSGIGLAFDNFSPSSAVPVPGAVWLLGSGLAGLAGIRTRKRKK